MTLTTTEANEQFDEALDATGRKEIVTIMEQGKPVAVLIDMEEYEQLRRTDDAFWAVRAEEARKRGYLGPEESMRFLLSRREETEAADAA